MIHFESCLCIDARPSHTYHLRCFLKVVVWALLAVAVLTCPYRIFTSIRLLIRHGGKLVDSDLIDHATRGHLWGGKERYQVMELLLAYGGKTNAMALQCSASLTLEAANGGQIAFNVAQMSGDEVTAV
jgi:hypothetical protein